MEVHSLSEDIHCTPTECWGSETLPSSQACSIARAPDLSLRSPVISGQPPSCGSAGSEEPQPFRASMPRPQPTSSSLAKPSTHPHLSSLPWHHLEEQRLSRHVAWHVTWPTGQFCFDSGSWAILCALSYGCSEDHTSTWGPTCAPLTTTHLEGWPWCPVHVGRF